VAFFKKFLCGCRRIKQKSNRKEKRKAQQRRSRCDKVDGSAADQTACGGLAARIATVGTECREPLT
ncbi:MAG: hypothetical protein VZR27_13815, partial [Acutalibacteraceae bacterium]|nr:hypothetical protein [Acutalibacteraceae bacterium]